MAKKRHETKPVYLLVDEPVGSIDEDILNLRPFADVIAGAALGTKGPFTIGVYADWGEGKTSVLRLARELVEDNNADIVTVWFNAWQYGKEDHPIVPLVATIAKSVGEKLKTVGKGKLKKGLSKMSAALRAIAYGFSAKGKVSVPGFGELEAGFVAKEMIDRYDQLQKGDDPLIEKTLYYNAFELLENMAKDGGSEIEAPKIAVFIDDLDRCNPPEAIKLLESIKLVLSQKGFVFALALDKRILQGYLKYRYEKVFKVKDYEASGKDYLDKIIQLPLPLLPHEGRFDDYIKKLLANNEALNHESNQPVKAVISNLQGVLSKGARFNPRNLVRFLNNLIVDRLLWKAVERQEAGIEVMGLCVISRILRDHFKDDRLYEYLWRNQDVCDRVRRFVLKEEAEGGKELFGVKIEGKEAGGRPAKIDEIIAKLREMEFLQDVLTSEQGRLWLKDKSMRESVNQFIVEQRKEEEPIEVSQDDEKVFDDEIRTIVNVEKGAITDELYEGITKLNLSVKGLKTVPAAIGKLAALQTLDLGGNKLTTVPEAIGKLAGLQWLNLGGNQLTTVAETIGKLTGLQMLNLGDNQLTTVAETIGKLAGLKTLYLGGNKLTTVPEAIGELAALQGLYLQKNQLTTLPEAIGNLTGLQTLGLGDNQLTTVPDAIGKLTGLQALLLHNNQLMTVPDAIGELAGLQVLYLGGNQLTTVAEAIFKLSGLETLSLDDNQLTTVPDAICKLTDLQTLSLGNNQLTTLPDAIGELTALQMLDLSGNQLTTLPDMIGELTGLQRLYLDNNQLTTVPDTISKLTGLQTLYLGGNQFSEEEKGRIRGLVPEGCRVSF
ncbi:MAG: leucine-rich repeat domain-containing protein [Phycisphaerae bacterium]|nr:leucine-rich repeat domain-containing protein [Phycisphaerae bacterium]